jgi:UDP-N-acetylglucosamine diphosphorylase / glucose-1-phosphate thymidylyltransferase / UDP-N-acetylgalactosamine diphosphorylase / glucosamine-1-phosphate N-acetyltransferase / galactosamine-1-phosphate N-acetyltransferase
MNLTGTEDLFDLTRCEHADLFSGTRHAWEVLGRLAGYLDSLLVPGIHCEVPPGSFIGPRVHLGEGCQVEPGVYIKGPAWIGPGCVLRQGLYVKENVIACAGAFLGHATELKDCLLFQEAEVPHFNYVGNSILGFKAHLGAGVILSNLRLDKKNVAVRLGGEKFDTGLEKFGALVGDGCEIGCNSVLNPGSIIGRGCVLYPLTRWRGVLPPGSVVKGLEW